MVRKVDAESKPLQRFAPFTSRCRVCHRLGVPGTNGRPPQAGIVSNGVAHYNVDRVPEATLDEIRRAREKSDREAEAARARWQYSRSASRGAKGHERSSRPSAR
jgi:hypothetical protein